MTTFLGGGMMPTFLYDALDAGGDEESGRIEALCSSEAVSKIRGKGLFPTKVQPLHTGKTVRLRNAADVRERRYAGGRVKIKAVTEFARQMSTLQDAGLAILRSLRILERQQKGTFRRVLGFVADDIEGGATLSEAMGKHPRTFGPLFVNMIAAGEVGGVLDVVLVRLADFMEKSQRLKAKIKGAMIYPATVLIAAFLITFGLMTFVIPKFADVLTQLDNGAQLPALTRGLMAIGNWLKGNYGLNAACVGTAPFALMFLVGLSRRFRRSRYLTDWLKLHLPMFRKLIYKTAVARWARTLATLTGAGVPILDALQIARDTAGNEVHIRMLDRAIRAIRQGDTFANLLQKSSIVDEIVVNMVEVGEETGDLDKMLLKVADNFDEQADVQVAAMMSLMEPVMILLLGIIVGTIVLAIFLPIINIIINSF
jgi:type IV pilus assembly protein PilC